MASMVGMAIAATHAHALVFNLNVVYTGATPGGSGPWAKITITDVATNKVNVRVDHLLTDVTEDRFISNVYLNLDPFVAGPPVISNEVNSNKRNGAVAFSLNGIAGAAGNNFDVRVPFQTSGSGGGVNRLKQGEFWSADLTATGLAAAKFNAVSDNGLFAGAHIQALTNSPGSGHITTPEPGTWAAVGLGALAICRRKRKS